MSEDEIVEHVARAIHGSADTTVREDGIADGLIPYDEDERAQDIAREHARAAIAAHKAALVEAGYKIVPFTPFDTGFIDKEKLWEELAKQYFGD